MFWSHFLYIYHIYPTPFSKKAREKKRWQALQLVFLLLVCLELESLEVMRLLWFSIVGLDQVPTCQLLQLGPLQVGWFLLEVRFNGFQVLNVLSFLFFLFFFFCCLESIMFVKYQCSLLSMENQTCSEFGRDPCNYKIEGKPLKS